MLLKAIESALLLAHFATYKEYIVDILVNFSTTYALKRLMKSIGDTNKADMVSLCGYTLTFDSFLKYLVVVKQNSKSTGAAPVEGLLPQLIDAIKDLKKN